MPETREAIDVTKMAKETAKPQIQFFESQYKQYGISFQNKPEVQKVIRQAGLDALKAPESERPKALEDALNSRLRNLYESAYIRKIDIEANKNQQPAHPAEQVALMKSQKETFAKTFATNALVKEGRDPANFPEYYQRVYLSYFQSSGQLSRSDYNALMNSAHINKDLAQRAYETRMDQGRPAMLAMLGAPAEIKTAVAQAAPPRPSETQRVTVPEQVVEGKAPKQTKPVEQVAAEKTKTPEAKQPKALASQLATVKREEEINRQRQERVEIAKQQAGLARAKQQEAQVALQANQANQQVKSAGSQLTKIEAGGDKELSLQSIANKRKELDAISKQATKLEEKRNLQGFDASALTRLEKDITNSRTRLDSMEVAARQRAAVAKPAEKERVASVEKPEAPPRPVEEPAKVAPRQPTPKATTTAAQAEAAKRREDIANLRKDAETLRAEIVRANQISGNLRSNDRDKSTLPAIARSFEENTDVLEKRASALNLTAGDKSGYETSIRSVRGNIERLRGIPGPVSQPPMTITLAGIEYGVNGFGSETTPYSVDLAPREYRNMTSVAMGIAIGKAGTKRESSRSFEFKLTKAQLADPQTIDKISKIMARILDSAHPEIYEDQVRASTVEPSIAAARKQQGV